MREATVGTLDKLNPQAQLSLDIGDHVADALPLHAEPDLASYDHIVCAFSGGKDSVACVLRLLEVGVPREKIELWHHDIDGREGSKMMDWPVTRAYVSRFAEALGLKIYFSWKKFGFEGELLRNNTATASTCFEVPGGEVVTVGGDSGKLGTRRKFPQVAASLTTRWCSAYLKIDVCAAALRNQDRFRGKRTLIVTGERAEESTARSRYASFEPHRADNRNGASRRHIDQFRPVHLWSESEVWAIIERWKINPHPAYRLGWGRMSCLFCIFGSCNQWASARVVSPDGFIKLADLESEFGVTIQRTRSVTQSADAGTPYDTITDDLIAEAMSEEFTAPMILDSWMLPAGAYGESCGPT